jgi:hypothetical protein
MLLSVSHRFIFFHVNKAAGTSVQRALEHFGDRPSDNSLSRLKSKLRLTRDYRKRFYAEHVHASQLRKQMPREVYDEYLKFAFVRNPWDWLASTYHYLCNTPTHRHHRRVTAMTSLAEYVDFEIARGKRSQAAFVCDGDAVIVDFVGRFETLEADFSSVCQQIGIEAALPHANKTEHSDYREYYDDVLIEKVAKHWRRDIDLFAYEFDGLQPSAKRNFITKL